jgi:nucleoside-triphosphatase
VGKTTVAERLVALLRDAHVPVSGFVTTEVREGGHRVGFSLRALGGERAVLAHVKFRGPPRVGRYGVDLVSLERLAIPALAAATDEGVAVVDELGKMELASAAFRDAIHGLFERPVPLVATVLAARHPFTDALKRSFTTETLRVTVQNRDDLPAQLAARLIGNA